MPSMPILSTPAFSEICSPRPASSSGTPAVTAPSSSAVRKVSVSSTSMGRYRDLWSAPQFPPPRSGGGLRWGPFGKSDAARLTRGPHLTSPTPWGREDRFGLHEACASGLRALAPAVVEIFDDRQEHQEKGDQEQDVEGGDADAAGGALAADLQRGEEQDEADDG